MRIGELADRTGSTTKTIRYYESIGVLPTPARTDAGYRTYHHDSIRRLQFIRDLQLAGLDLATIRSILDVADASHRVDDAHDLVRRTLRQVDHRIAQLRRMRAELDGIAAATL